MTFVTHKRAVIAALYRYLLSLTMTVALSLGTVQAAESTTPYQSTFEDYKATITQDTQTEWKSHDTAIAGDGHAMSDMPHTADQATNHDSMEPPMSHGGTHASPDAHADGQAMDHHNMVEMGDTASPSVTAHAHDHASIQPTGMGHAVGHPIGHSMDSVEQTMSMAHAHHTSADEIMVDENSDAHSGHHHPSGEAADHGMPPEPAGFQVIPNWHPAIVHFPIALTIVACMLGLLARLFHTSKVSVQLAIAGYYALLIAALAAIGAVTLGWLAFNAPMNHDDAGHAAMLLHRAWAIPTAAGLVLLAAWQTWRLSPGKTMPLPALACLLGLSVAIAITAWLGGEIVYRHGIGVLSLPAAGNHQHAAHHGNATASEDTTEEVHTGHQHSLPAGDSHEH